MDQKNQESGQIILLLAISLLVLIVVAALAVDGGMIYSERRYVQNAADSASLAGGGAALNYMETPIYEMVDDGNGNLVPGRIIGYKLIADDFIYDANGGNCIKDSNIKIEEAISKAYLAAENVAASNNFPNIKYLGRKVYIGEDANGNAKWQPYPLISSTNLDIDDGIIIYCHADDNFIDTEVRITSTISTAFAHLIFPSDLATTNRAISRTIAKTPLVDGNGIVSLSDVCPPQLASMEFTGTGDINVIGGGIHTNSCFVGSGDITVTVNGGTGSISLVKDDLTLNGVTLDDINANWNIPADPMPMPDVQIPSCEPEKTITNPLNVVEGTYTGGISIQNGNWFFQPGIYCLYDDLKITGGTVTGSFVAFYMVEGNVTITGNAEVNLSAPISGDLAGMLFFVDYENPDGDISLIGTNNSLFTGTVFSPVGSIEVGGTSTGVSDKAATFNTQLIGWTVKVVGTSQVDVFYNGSNNYYNDGKMFLLQ
jgi:hypothetical protein